MSFEEVSSLTLRRFWFLCNKIERIRSEELLMQLQIIGSATSQESFTATFDRLQERIGQIIVMAPDSSELDMDQEFDPEFDRAALNRLKFSLAR